MTAKTIRQTILIIDEDQFELKYIGIGLNYDPPYQGYSVTTGTTKWRKNTLKLYQHKKTNSTVIYGKQNNNIPENTDNDIIQSEINLEKPGLRGNRENVTMPIDTLQGQIQYMDNSEPIILDIIKSSEATYFVNKKFCFVKYHDNDSTNVNKCDEIQKNYK